MTRRKARNFIVRTKSGRYTWSRHWGLFRRVRPQVMDHCGCMHIEAWPAEREAEQRLVRHIWRQAMIIKNRRQAGRREVPPYRHVGTGDLKGHL